MTSDKRIIFWDQNKLEKMIMQFKFDLIQTEVHFFEDADIWLTLSYNYVIRGWKASFLEKSLIEMLSIPAHKDKLTGILEVFNIYYSDTSSSNVSYRFT